MARDSVSPSFRRLTVPSSHLVPLSLTHRRKSLHPLRSPGAAAPEWYWLHQPPPGFVPGGGGRGSGRVVGPPPRCATCSTSTTPMWRKSRENGATLCNACGLRERRALASVGRRSGGGGVTPEKMVETPAVPPPPADKVVAGDDVAMTPAAAWPPAAA